MVVLTLTSGHRLDAIAPPIRKKKKDCSGRGRWHQKEEAEPTVWCQNYLMSFSQVRGKDSSFFG